MRHKGSLLEFKDNGALYRLEFMPHILGDVNAIDAVFLADDDAFDDGTVIVICSDSYSAAQNNKRLFFFRVMMDWYIRPRLHSV